MRYLDQDLKALFKLSGTLYLLVFSVSGYGVSSFDIDKLQNQKPLKVQNLISKYKIEHQRDIHVPTKVEEGASKYAMPIGQLLQSDGLKVVHLLQNNLPSHQVSHDLDREPKQLKEAFLKH